MTLINFDSAHNFLDNIHIPRLDAYSNNVIIDRVDFTAEERKGKIKWREDGVYLNIRGEYQRGFMYIKRPYLTRYTKDVEKINDRPRFHVVNCTTIEKQRNDGNFDNRYYWSNSPTISLFDFDNGCEYPEKELKLCRNCQELITEDVSNTEDFHELLDLNDKEVDNKTIAGDVDIFNRPLNWRVISRAYRLEQNYTCEECGFGGGDLESNYDKRYIHTHHIDGYALLNTHRNNLKSLCVLCHYNADEHHQSNFEKPRLKRELNEFIHKYKPRLVAVNNPYVNDL